MVVFLIFDIEGNKPMKNTENKIFSDTKKTVIFIHPAVQFVLDGSITGQATYIKMAEEDLHDSGENIFYYMQAMREAAASDKPYLIMEYEPVLGGTIDALMRAPEQYNFCGWHFDTFFHADTCPEGAAENPMYNANDDKMEVLLWFQYCPLVWKFTIPVGYVLTHSDMQKLRKDYSEPETPKELRRLMWNLRKGIKPKKLFPFYEANYQKLMDYANRREKEG